MICINCVTPTPLKKFVYEKGIFTTCKYCEKDGAAAESKVVFDFILERVCENLATEGDLSSFEELGIYDLGADDIDTCTIDVVLAEWFDLGEEPYLDDLEEYLPDFYLKNDQGGARHFYRDDGELERNFYEDKWEKFISDIRHSHRFFNQGAEGFLDSVFGFLSTEDGDLKPEVIRTLYKGQEFFRARTVQDYASAKRIEDDPVSQLGPTPNNKSSNQRMTPNGISALYCALERGTCLSEIRAITGDYVVSGAMTPTTKLKFLDLTMLNLVEPPKLSLFDKGYLDALHLKTFIDSLVKKMSKPKGRNDELSYLSTQIVFEYLRLRFSEQVDGLVFPSVQTGGIGVNVVLFPEACIISKNKYFPPKLAEQLWGENVEIEPDMFADGEKLAFVENSLSFHKITAIETKHDEYSQIEEFFMNDLVRKRLGLYFPQK